MRGSSAEGCCLGHDNDNDINKQQTMQKMHLLVHVLLCIYVVRLVLRKSTDGSCATTVAQDQDTGHANTLLETSIVQGVLLTFLN